MSIYRGKAFLCARNRLVALLKNWKMCLGKTAVQLRNARSLAGYIFCLYGGLLWQRSDDVVLRHACVESTLTYTILWHRTGSRAPAKTHTNAYLSMCNANGFGSVKIVMKSSISFEMRRTERFCFSVFQLLPGRARRVSDAFVLSRPNYVLLEFSDSLPWLAGASFSRFCDGTYTMCVVNVAVVLTGMVAHCIFVRL